MRVGLALLGLPPVEVVQFFLPSLRLEGVEADFYPTTRLLVMLLSQEVLVEVACLTALPGTAMARQATLHLFLHLKATAAAIPRLGVPEIEVVAEAAEQVQLGAMQIQAELQQAMVAQEPHHLFLAVP